MEFCNTFQPQQPSLGNMLPIMGLHEFILVGLKYDTCIYDFRIGSGVT
jgi:hypothetical protein